jgi:hypothetical protein
VLIPPSKPTPGLYSNNGSLFSDVFLLMLHRQNSGVVFECHTHTGVSCAKAQESLIFL